jgi:hypothetical protein
MNDPEFVAAMQAGENALMYLAPDVRATACPTTSGLREREQRARPNCAAARAPWRPAKAAGCQCLRPTR